MKVRNRKIGSNPKPTPKYVIKNCRWSVVVFFTWRFGTPKKRPFYHTQNLIGVSDSKMGSNPIRTRKTTPKTSLGSHVALFVQKLEAF